jgi:uncharacterized DUF497 family protein
MSLVTYEWDIAKEASNIEKNKVDFETASLIFERWTVSRLDDRFDYGEKRVISYGEAYDRIWVVVWTPRSELRRRIISARRASRDEREYYRTACERGEADPPD